MLEQKAIWGDGVIWVFLLHFFLFTFFLAWEEKTNKTPSPHMEMSYAKVLYRPHSARAPRALQPFFMGPSYYWYMMLWY
jgi:hypothetical protein